MDDNDAKETREGLGKPKRVRKAARPLKGEPSPKDEQPPKDKQPLKKAKPARKARRTPGAEPSERPPEKPEKPEKTPEDLAAIAYLDRLRRGEGEVMPTSLPLACVVRVVAYEEIPKANERYALVTVQGPDGRQWKMSIPRYYLEKGMDALFVSKDAAMPDEERFRNREAARVKVRAYKFGFGVKVRVLLPIVNRSIYHFNCGLLYPMDDFPELASLKVGASCAARLGIDSVIDLRARLAAPRPKQYQPTLMTFGAKAKKVGGISGFLAKVRRRRSDFMK